jgi:uncharacterized protein (TIGR00251 family)
MIIKIKVKPGSCKQEIIKIKDNEFIVYLREKPENNKANLELIKLLKKHFHKNIKIIKGLKNRNKIIELK